MNSRSRPATRAPSEPTHTGLPSKPPACESTAPERKKAWRYGRTGEVVAVALLRLKGYRVLARRVRVGAGEIDIVARRGGLLAFVEVKARGDLAAAAEALLPVQRRRIVRAAEVYLQRHPRLAGMDVRFDLILIRPWAWPIHLSEAWRPET